MQINWAFQSKSRDLAEWVKEHNPTICCFQETYFRFKDTLDSSKFKVKGQKKMYNANNNQKTARVVIFLSDIRY